MARGMRYAPSARCNIRPLFPYYTGYKGRRTIRTQLEMKKATIIPVALFAAASLAGAVFIGGSYGAHAQATPVTCSPSVVSAAPGQSVSLSATGGNGTYVWSSPGLTITNPNGQNFKVNFNGDGSYPVTVTSGSSSSTCNVNVTGVAVGSSTSGSSSTGGNVPGLPNTGALPE